MSWGVDECVRIEVALKELGYPAPVKGMPTDHALKLIADAVEDIAKKKPKYCPYCGKWDEEHTQAYMAGGLKIIGCPKHGESPTFTMIKDLDDALNQGRKA